MDTVLNNGKLRTLAIILATVLTIFVVVKIIHEVAVISRIGSTEPVANVISVSGKGEVTATPNIASFSFSVEESASNVADAQTAATKKTNAILEYIKKNNVADKDIKTLSYNIYPRYDYQNGTYYNPGKQILSAYVVSQTVEIKVRNMSEAGKLLTGIGEFGATNVSGLSFSVDNQEQLMLDARDKAITDARDQAKKLANALGVKLGAIRGFYESMPYQPMYYGRDMLMSASGSAKEGAAPELPSGESKIKSEVTVTYEIR